MDLPLFRIIRSGEDGQVGTRRAQQPPVRNALDGGIDKRRGSAIRVQIDDVYPVRLFPMGVQEGAVVAHYAEFSFRLATVQAVIPGGRGFEPIRLDLDSLGIPLVDDDSAPLELFPIPAPTGMPVVRCDPVRQGLVWDRMDVVVLDVPGDTLTGRREEVVGEDKARGSEEFNRVEGADGKSALVRSS